MNTAVNTARYHALTDSILVEVWPQYSTEQSNPEQNLFIFIYRVKIWNKGPSPSQLLSRKWIIRDGFGLERLVEGPGVVGNQPEILPGEFYEYASFSALPTPRGSMRGSYRFIHSDGRESVAEIPLFFLRSDLVVAADQALTSQL